jgi:hypothetical protein
MTRHPLLMGIAVMDGLALLLLIAAALTALRILAGWAPGSADRRQIELETAAEGAALHARIAFGFFAVSTVLLIAAIANALPPIVPGAMCGTGVLQATDGRGGRALLFRLLGLAALYLWRTTEDVNRSQPESPLAVPQARVLLLALPAVFLGAVDTVRAAGVLSSHGPVSCCAVIYDRVRSATGAGRTAGLPDGVWVWAFVVAGLLLLGAAGWAAAKRRPSMTSACLPAVASILWVPVAGIALVRVLAAYHYGVLHHHCPWCLFLPDHYGVGYPLFGALAVAVLEGPAAWVAAGRRAGRRIIAAVILFFLLSAGPAILWRLRFGVWMG